jgi:hypothetical protein
MVPSILAAATVAAAALASAVAAHAQFAPLDRLPPHVLDVSPPTDRVSGEPGAMVLRAQQPCRSLPIAQARQRIVEVAVQEWGFFGFPVVEYDEDEEGPSAGPGGGTFGSGGTGAGSSTLGRGPVGGGGGGRGGGGRGRGAGRIGTPEAARTAASIAGYWAVTPGGGWILQNQNEYWREALVGVTRWRFPWSAAFLSWVMCEGGIGAPEQFQRAIAHHTYIDQAIRARDARAARPVYIAQDMGEAEIAPGDMLCSSRRPVFRTLADRRRQLGQGARTHCDLVVKVDEAAGRILAIGGNVRGVVGLKIFPAARQGRTFRPLLPASFMAERPLFAHLQFRGAPVAATVFDSSPTVRRVSCAPPALAAGQQALVLRSLIPPDRSCTS